MEYGRGGMVKERRLGFQCAAGLVPWLNPDTTLLRVRLAWRSSCFAPLLEVGVSVCLCV